MPQKVDHRGQFEIQEVLAGSRSWALLRADCVEGLRALPAASAQTCVTSPPYWGLRDYGVEGQLGLEPTPAIYVRRLVRILRGVRRVLREDGTLWLVLGDCYATGAGRVGNHPGGGDQGARWKGPNTQPNRMRLPGLKPKDLVGIPWRVAFALQEDGWWLRSDIVWAKPNPMPESVRDRPTRAHEFIFLLAKRAHYYYDADAIAEPASTAMIDQMRRAYLGEGTKDYAANGVQNPSDVKRRIIAGKSGNKDRKYGHQVGSLNNHMGRSLPWEGVTRNRRTVWTIHPQPFRGTHFAVMPELLVEPCIKAGASEKGGCCECGAPWRREVRREFQPQSDVSRERGLRGTTGQKPMDQSNGWQGFPRGTTAVKTVGWRTTCACRAGDPVPQVVLDPFAGAGTTGIVAIKNGRRFIGIELNPAYVDMARRRLEAVCSSCKAWHRVSRAWPASSAARATVSPASRAAGSASSGSAPSR